MRGLFGRGLKVAKGFGPHLVEMGAQPRYALGIELIKTACSGAVVEDKARIFEDFEVLRDRGAADGEMIGEFVDGQGAGGELLEDCHPRCISEGVESGL